MNARRTDRGFTLVEILVGMAIFVSIMAGVVVLFSGAIETVAQGNQMIDGFEKGRMTLDLLDRDLKSAFMSRDRGQLYQFYGGPDGFMFVGMTESGQLGRVAYTMYPSPDSPYFAQEVSTFETILTEPWDHILARVCIQAKELAEAAEMEVGVTGLAPAAVSAAEAQFREAYPVPTDATGTPDPDIVIEFNVQVSTGVLLRFEDVERFGDLDTFELPQGGEWPYIDPENPSYDDYDAEGGNRDLYIDMLTAINPYAGSDYRSDLRTLIDEANRSTSTASRSTSTRLKYVDADTVEQMVNAQRRQIWMRMLAGGDAYVPNYWYTKDINPVDYVMADSIVMRAALRYPQGHARAGQFLMMPQYYPGEQARPFDMLYTSSYFAYTNTADEEEADYTIYWNDNENIPGYETLMGDLIHGTGDAVGALTAFDAKLADTMAFEQLGSPLQPDLPAMVRPGFYIMIESASVGAPDFLGYFTQNIDVPAGFTVNTGGAG